MSLSMQDSVGTSTPSVRNTLLRRLAPEDLQALGPHLTQVHLDVRAELGRFQRKLDMVHFVESGYASLTAARESADVEIGMIGREGFTGVFIALGVDEPPCDMLVQHEGRAQAVEAEVLRELIERRPSLHRVLLLYAHALFVQIGQTARANARGRLEERLARWLLMAHDRVEGDQLATVHEFLALMLGVRRAGVTVGLQNLEGRGLIRSRRGMITVVDREGLCEAAGGLYGQAEAAYRRVLG